MDTKFAKETCSLCDKKGVVCRVSIPRGRHFGGWHVCLECDTKLYPSGQVEIIFEVH